MKTTLLYLTLVLLISSCAVHSGSISGNYLPTDAYYKDIALGFSQTKRFFGMGGLSKDALILEAKDNLHFNHPLQLGESFANYTVDVKLKHFFPLLHLECTVSADVISTMEEKSTERYSELYLQKTRGASDSTKLFLIGDTVNVKNKEMVIVGFRNKNKLKLATENNYQTRYINVLKKNAISKVSSHRGFNLGEAVKLGSSTYLVAGFKLHEIRLEDAEGAAYNASYYKVKKLK